jgi:TolA-binding protein
MIVGLGLLLWVGGNVLAAVAPIAPTPDERVVPEEKAPPPPAEKAPPAAKKPVPKAPPSEMETPAEPEKPAEKAPPAETEKPAEKAPPAEMEKPAEKAPPVVIEKPAESEKPVEKAPPIVVEKPAETAPPAEAEKPVEKAPPLIVIEKPVEKAPPIVIEKPAEKAPPVEVAPPDTIETPIELPPLPPARPATKPKPTPPAEKPKAIPAPAAPKATPPAAKPEEVATPPALPEEKPLKPQDLQKETAEAQAEAEAGTDLAGMNEVGLVEEVASARKNYERALSGLKAYYAARGNATKTQWADQEMGAVAKVPKAKYLTIQEMGGPDLKPTRDVPAANQLYSEGMQFKGYPAMPPDKKKYLQQALDKFETIIQKYPDSSKISDAAFRMGEIYGGWYFQDFARAVQAYERCVQWNPRSPYPAMFNAAKIYEENLDNRVKAVELYNRVIGESPNPDLQKKARERIKALTGK